MKRCIVGFLSEVLLSCFTENKDVSSAKSLAFEGNPSDKLLIYIENNNGQSMEPCGTPALTSDESETCPFNKTFCFLFLRKSHKRFSKLPNISFCFNLKMRPYAKVCLKPFDIFRETPLTLNASSNDLYIS